MNTKMGIAFLICLAVGIGYGCYRKGYSEGAAKVTAGYLEETKNDLNGDPSVKHSAIYSLAYSRGHENGFIESRQRALSECGDKLSEVAIEANNPNIAGRLLVDGYISTLQLEAAQSRLRTKR